MVFFTQIAVENFSLSNPTLGFITWAQKQNKVSEISVIFLNTTFLKLMFLESELMSAGRTYVLCLIRLCMPSSWTYACSCTMLMKVKACSPTARIHETIEEYNDIKKNKILLMFKTLL